MSPSPSRSSLVVADIVGTGDDVADLLRQSMGEAGIGDDSSVLLFAVGSSRPAANEAVFDLADRLAQGRRSPVRACFGTCPPSVADVLDGLPEPVAILPLFLCRGSVAFTGSRTRGRARLADGRAAGRARG